MPREAPVRVARELASRGYNAEREAVTILAAAGDVERAVDAAVARTPDDALKVGVDHARAAMAAGAGGTPGDEAPGGGASGPPTGDAGDGRAAADGSAAPASTSTSPSTATTDDTATSTASAPATQTPEPAPDNPTVSRGPDPAEQTDTSSDSPVEAKGSARADSTRPTTANDVTGRSTGTGTYGDFVAVFRDRYERLGAKLRGRVTHRPAEAIAAAAPGSEVAMVGMLNDVRSTAGGHWLLELEDPSGTFPCLVLSDRDVADEVPALLLDEVVAVEGTLADDGGIVFVDALHLPDVPRTFQPSTADRHVQAALVSDLHVGSQEFLGDAWDAFAGWLHTEEAAAVEYLLIAGDMVEGVGVYPGQEAELSVVDVYEQYEAFAERLKAVPGDLEIVLIPGNHDAVRLAEPQPAFDEELRAIMSAHDAQLSGNPSVVTVEGVDVLMYHGVSLDEVIAEIPDASYERPHEAMAHLLKKRHLAPQFGGRMRIAPEERDYLVVEEVPDVFHAGHVHKLGVGRYHNVLTVNSGTWQSQTNFQQSVDLEPDPAVAPIVDLDTLDVTVRKFA